MSIDGQPPAAWRNTSMTRFVPTLSISFTAALPSGQDRSIHRAARRRWFIASD
jgi:hypothetical protein